MTLLNRQIFIQTAILSTIVLCGCGGTSSSAVDSPVPPGGNTNRPPAISGTPPASIVADNPYTFLPQASDPDGDRLTFNIQNQPGWANFDQVTGELSGTPTVSDVGLFANIAISVSDGSMSTSMSQFAIDVTQVGTTSTTLSWSAPTLNNDGSPLNDLAGYVLFYGQSSGNYTNEIRIDNPGITTYVVDGLGAGIYYFAAKSVNAAGVESGISAEAFKDLTGT